MQKIVVITNCLDCPHKTQIGYCKWKCLMMNKEIPDGGTIPAWCNLRDV